jgi:uncharacterized membrane protein YhaH (DUF805 family)
LKKFAVCQGRAGRKEYWQFTLCNILVTLALVYIDGRGRFRATAGTLSTIYSLAVIIPTIAASVRRLHDIGKSGWAVFFTLGVLVLCEGLACLKYLHWVELEYLWRFLIWLFSTHLVPCGIPLFLLYFLIEDSEDEENQYGLNPKIEDKMMENAKNRHGCLTAWLVLMIIANSVVASMCILGSGAICQAIPDMPGWSLPMLIAMSLFNVICALALLEWQKWGFWGFCASNAVAVIVNLSIGFGIGTAFGGLVGMLLLYGIQWFTIILILYLNLGGLVGMLLLYGVLHIGKENKGWTQLE